MSHDYWQDMHCDTCGAVLSRVEVEWGKDKCFPCIKREDDKKRGEK